MNFPLYLARRISKGESRKYSTLMVRMAIAGIMLGLAVMILSIAVLRGFKESITSKERGFNGDITVYKNNPYSDYESAPFHLSEDSLKVLRAISGIQSVQAFATKPGVINTGDAVEGVVLKGIDSLYNQGALEQMLVSGHGIRFSDSVPAQQQIVVSAYLANRLNLELDDDFIMYFVQEPLRKRKFTVVGIYKIGVDEIDKSYVIGDMNLIRRLNNWSSQEVGGYEVHVQDFGKLDLMNEELLNLLPVRLISVTVAQQYPQIFDWLAMLDINSQIILILMILVAAINMISALLILILERTNMIGILKALGFSNAGLRKAFLYQAAYLIGLGLLLGNVLGVGICLVQHYTHWLKLDEADYYISYVPVDLRFVDVCLLNLGTLVLTLLALLVPSGLVSRISPIKAIRFK